MIDGGRRTASIVCKTNVELLVIMKEVSTSLFLLPLNVFRPTRPYKARFIANSSSCTTTELSKLLTSCLTAIKKHVIKYCDKVFERSGRNLFWSIKNSNEVLNKLKSRQFRAFSLSTYDFSTLYTTLPHNLIKEKLNDLNEWPFHREDSLYLACNVRNAFFLLLKCIKIAHYGHVRKCLKLSPYYLTIFI